MLQSGRCTQVTLAFSVVAIGAAGTLWSGYVGARRRGLVTPGAALALLPYQLLICAAAWGGLFDLFRRPYHWHKTVHGEAARAGRGDAHRITGAAVCAAVAAFPKRRLWLRSTPPSPAA